MRLIAAGDEVDQSDEIASMMEALWGPRTEGPNGAMPLALDASHRPQHDQGPPPVADESPAVSVVDQPAADAEAVQVQLEALVRQHVDALRADLTSTVDALRAEVRAALDAFGAPSPSSTSTEPVDALRARLERVVEQLGQLDGTTADLAALRARLDVVDGNLQRLAQAVEAVGSEAVRAADLDVVRAEVNRLASNASPAPVDELEALRAQLGAMAAAVAGARDDAVSVVDERLAGAEDRLSRRLDEVAAAGHDGMARVDAVEREAAQRHAALEQRVDVDAMRTDVTAQVADAVAQVRREVAAVSLETAEARAAALTHAELAAARSEMESGFADQLATLRAELTPSSDEAPARLADVDDVRSAIDAVESRLVEEVARLRRSLAGDAAERAAQRAAQRAELDATNADQAGAMRAELDDRLELLADQLRAELSRPGRMIRRKDVARRSDAVAVVPKDAVVTQVVSVLRSELNEVLAQLGAAQAEMQHRIIMLDKAANRSEEEMIERLDSMAEWVVSEATKAAQRAPAPAQAGAGNLAPLRSDVRALEEQLDEVKALVADLRRRPSAGRRPPLLKSASPSQQD